MGHQAKRGGKLTIHYIEPTYASEEERQAAIARAKAAIMELAGLLGQMVAAEMIQDAKEHGTGITGGTRRLRPRR